MGRPKRCEFRGAIHLVTLSGYTGGHVFYDSMIFTKFPNSLRRHASGAERFESLLWETCEQYDAQIHAYFIEPNAARVVIQTGGAPLGWIAHDLLARYSVHLRAQHLVPDRTKPFPRRYKTQIVQPSKLPYAVRYVQRRANAGEPRRRAINHPFSSGLIYCGRKPRPQRFVVSAMRETLETLGYSGSSAYFEFMEQSDSPAIAHLLARPIIGERGFAASVRERCRKPHRVPSPDDILREVTTTLLHTEPAVACSSTHLGALARALVAWYAMQAGTARIGTVAKWFGVTSADLRYLIRRHRQVDPRYFSQPASILFAQEEAPPTVLSRDQRGPSVAGDTIMHPIAQPVA